MECDVLPFVVLATVAIFTVCYIIIQVLADFDFYSKDSGFPSPTVFFLGTFVSFYCIAILGASIRKEGTSPLWTVLIIPIFYLLYWLFCMNLTLRTEYYVKGSRLPKLTGAFHLFLALFILCMIAGFAKTSLIGLIFVPIAWVVFLMWMWLKKI